VIFTALPLGGAYLIEPARLEDQRGFFARTWCARDVAARGLNPCVAQCNVSFNRRRGTLRGMHYQVPPSAEAKVVRCTAGAIYDVILDLRESSPTYTQWFAAELTAANRSMLYVPEGFAHGFQSLTDDSEVFYQMSQFFDAEASRGLRWNDPAFGIDWPLASPIMSAKDAAYPDFVQ
jgi:dTDP-4-dehydrorhamnose 3,5-epimerase